MQSRTMYMKSQDRIIICTRQCAQDRGLNRQIHSLMSTKFNFIDLCVKIKSGKRERNIELCTLLITAVTTLSSEKLTLK